MKPMVHEIEMVTWCISGGADPGRAEIRAGSVRGQLRWWFRALGGSAQEEMELFGGVHGDARKSRVTVRIETPAATPVRKNLHDLFGKDANDPKAYLLWPLRPSARSNAQRGMYEPGATFGLMCRLPEAASERHRILYARLSACMDLWVLLGSLGTRGRRGFGSLMFREDAMNTSHTIASFGERIRSTMAPLGKPDVRILTLAGPQDSEVESLHHLGSWLKGRRAGSPKSGTPSKWGQNDHDVAPGSVSGVLYRPVLGLPLTQRYSNGTSIKTDFEAQGRWASPIHLKVLKWGGRFYPLTVIFPQMAIPEGSMVRVTNAAKHQSRKVPVAHDLLHEMGMPTDGGVVVWPIQG